MKSMIGALALLTAYALAVHAGMLAPGPNGAAQACIFALALVGGAILAVEFLQ